MSSLNTFSSFDSFGEAPPDPPPSTPTKRNIKFDSIIIRTFNPTMSDNPSVSCGPPVGLDWAHSPTDKSTPIDVYESDRLETRRDITIFAQIGRLDPEQRLQTCQAAGYTDSEIEGERNECCVMLSCVLLSCVLLSCVVCAVE